MTEMPKRMRLGVAVLAGVITSSVMPAMAQPPTCTTSGGVMNCTFPAPSATMLPATCSFAVGVVVPMPTLPAPAIETAAVVNVCPPPTVDGMNCSVSAWVRSLPIFQLNPVDEAPPRS